MDVATAGFKTGIQYAMTNLDYTLTKMMNCADGAGNLLDNSMVYITSCTGESVNHSQNDFPIMVAGKARGLLKGNQHVRMVSTPTSLEGAPNGDNTSKVGYTLLTMMGRPAAPWGMAEAQVSSGISALLA